MKPDPYRQKFKCYNTQKKELSFGMVIPFLVGYCLAKYQDGSLENLIYIEFTGEVDLQGDEIYDGDICEHVNSLFGIGEVYFQEESYYFKTQLLGGCSKKLTKKGNIYQNPELIKTKDEETM